MEKDVKILVVVMGDGSYTSRDMSHTHRAAQAMTLVRLMAALSRMEKGIGDHSQDWSNF